MIQILIPARLSSTRLPGKPLMCIEGKPQIIRLVESISEIFSEANIMVLTDSEAVVWVVEDSGFSAFLTGEASNGTERISKAVGKLSLSADDLVVNIQGDVVPLTEKFLRELKSIVDGADHIVRNNEWATIVSTYDHNARKETASVWALVDESSKKAVDFDRSANGAAVNGSMSARKHIGIYLYSMNMLEIYGQTPPSPLEISRALEQMRLVEAGYMPTVFTMREIPLELNTEDDYIQIAKAIGQRRGLR